MEFTTRRSRNSFLNLTPLIDVVFLMLVFFLLTSSFVRYRSLDLVLVDTGALEFASGEGNFVIRLSGAGDLTLDGRPVNVNELEPVLRARLEASDGLAGIVLTADSAPLQTIVVVLERVREAGVADIRIGRLADDGV